MTPSRVYLLLLVILYLTQRFSGHPWDHWAYMGE
jgi:hypothetical protein